MSDTASGGFARFRPRLPKLPPGQLFNASGRAGPRRLALAGLGGLSVLGLVVGVALSGRTSAPTSADTRMKQMDPLPGGLNSTPEQDALSVTATDQQAITALHNGTSYTPPMAPSQPTLPLQPPAPPISTPAPAAAAPGITFVGRPVPRPVFRPVPAAPASPTPVATAPHDATIRPTLVAAPAQAQDAQAQAQAQQAYAKQISDMMSQWGGRAPRTEMVMPPAQSVSDNDDPPATQTGARATRVRDATPAAMPVSTRSQGRILVPAGRGIYAHPVLALNSDETSPVVLQADSGPIAGDRMIGTFAKQSNRLIIHISTIIHNGENISCDGVVTAPDTMEASVASQVDEHYIARFLLPAAAAFVSGLGQAIATTSNTTAVLSPLGGATTTTHLNIPQQLGIAAGAAGQQAGQTINQEAPKGPTISLEANVAIGVMFLSNVTSREAD